MIISFVVTTLAESTQTPTPPPDNPFTQSVVLSGLVAGIVAGLISLVVTKMNHKNETRKWLREEKLRVYIKFLEACREFIEDTSMVYRESNLSPDERYKKYLSLKSNEIRLIGSHEVVTAYALALTELRKYWRLIKDKGLILTIHQDQVSMTNQAIDQLGFVMRAELQESEPFYIRLWHWLVQHLITNPREEFIRQTALTLNRNRRIRIQRKATRERKRISRIRRQAVRKQKRRLAKASKPDA